MYLSEKLFQRPREVYFGVYFPSCEGSGEMNTKNNTLVSAETVRYESTYVILFLTWHNESINDYKTDDLYTSSSCLTRSVLVLLMMSQSIADDVTMTRQLWLNRMNNNI